MQTVSLSYLTHSECACARSCTYNTPAPAQLGCAMWERAVRVFWTVSTKFRRDGGPACGVSLRMACMLARQGERLSLKSMVSVFFLFCRPNYAFFCKSLITARSTIFWTTFSRQHFDVYLPHPLTGICLEWH